MPDNVNAALLKIIGVSKKEFLKCIALPQGEFDRFLSDTPALRKKTLAKLFDLEASGYFYTRLQNPTNDYAAAKICELEGGTAAMLTSSGQAANFYAIMNIAEAGDHIICSSAVYGGTYNLYAHTIRKMGISATFVDPDCTEEELNEYRKIAAFLQNMHSSHAHSCFAPKNCCP